MSAPLPNCRLPITGSLILIKNRKPKSLSISFWFIPFTLLNLLSPIIKKKSTNGRVSSLALLFLIFLKIEKICIQNLCFTFKINYLIFQVLCKQLLFAKAANAKKGTYGAHNHGVVSPYTVDGSRMLKQLCPVIWAEERCLIKHQQNLLFLVEVLDVLVEDSFRWPAEYPPAASNKGYFSDI